MKVRNQKKAKRLIFAVITALVACVLTLLTVLCAPPAKAAISGIHSVSLSKTTVAPGESVTYTMVYAIDNDPTVNVNGPFIEREIYGEPRRMGPTLFFGLVDGSSSTFTHTFTAPVTPGTYHYYIDATGTSLNKDFGIAVLTVKAPTPTPNPVIDAPGVPAPTPAPDPGPPPVNEFDKRHYDFCLPLFTQLNSSGNNGNVVIDTAGFDILNVQHFVFDALVGTNRTLTIKHKGETYVIRGAPEGAGGRMGSVLLGHNHTFEMLEAYRVK